jgi:hypothetical protein
MSKGSHPRILENIFSVMQVPGNPQNNTKHCFAMTPAKFGTRKLVAVPRRCHQLRLTCGRQRGSRLIQSIFQCNLSFQNYRPIRVYRLADRINAIHWPIAQSFRKQATRMDKVSGKS